MWAYLLGDRRQCLCMRVVRTIGTVEGVPPKQPLNSRHANVRFWRKADIGGNGRG